MALGPSGVQVGRSLRRHVSGCVIRRALSIASSLFRSSSDPGRPGSRQGGEQCSPGPRRQAGRGPVVRHPPPLARGVEEQDLRSLADFVVCHPAALEFPSERRSKIQVRSPLEVKHGHEHGRPGDAQMPLLRLIALWAYLPRADVRVPLSGLAAKPPSTCQPPPRPPLGNIVPP